MRNATNTLSITLLLIHFLLLVKNYFIETPHKEYPTPRNITSANRFKHAMHQRVKFQTKTHQAHLREHTHNNREPPNEHPTLKYK